MVDLIVANYTDATVSVLLGNGQGGFGASNTFQTGTGPGALAIADVNGDLRPDILVSSTALHVLVNLSR